MNFQLKWERLQEIKPHPQFVFIAGGTELAAGAAVGAGLGAGVLDAGIIGSVGAGGAGLGTLGAAGALG